MGLRHVSAVGYHLQALRNKGWIELLPDQNRGIRLVKDECPVVPSGTIAAGEPILAEGRVVERLPYTITRRFVPKPDYFLQVRGDSMDRVGLRDGDLVAIQAVPEAVHGQIVVARIDNEVTLKRFVRTARDRVELCPESYNEEHQPIVIDLSNTELNIDGVAVGALIGRLADVNNEKNGFS